MIGRTFYYEKIRSYTILLFFFLLSGKRSEYVFGNKNTQSKLSLREKVEKNHLPFMNYFLRLHRRVFWFWKFLNILISFFLESH